MPTRADKMYVAPITINTPGTTVVKAIMTRIGQADSAVASASFQVMPRVDTPTADIVSGYFVDSVKVHLSCGTESATIRYTTNGHTPNAASAEYVDGITLGLDSQGSEARYIIKAIGILVPQMAYSLVMVSGSILVQPQVAPPNFEPDPSVGPVPDKVLVTLSDLGADVFYTVDGSNPMTSRSILKYDGPFLMSRIFPGTNTVSAFAIRHHMAPSEVKTVNYVIKHQACTPVFSRREGSYIVGVPITIACVGGKQADIYVSFKVVYEDGSNVEESGKVLYSKPYQLDEIGNTTIAAVAIGKDLISSNVILSPQYIVEAEPVCEAGDYEPGSGSVR